MTNKSKPTMSTHNAQQPDINEIKRIISQGETLTVEFKSDQSRLPDKDILATVVGLANTDGGLLFIGVEDDGTITGLHKTHQNAQGLASFIANRTSPPANVKATKVSIDGIDIAIVEVLRSFSIIATSDGLVQRRRLKIDGTPESVPFLPHEFIQRQSALGLTDPSSLPITGVQAHELDLIQRIRLRQAIGRYHGDGNLSKLDDEELDLALGLITDIDGKKHPTLTGLLLLGTEQLLKTHLPAHEVAFQVLSGTDVKVNKFFTKPLLEVFEEIELLFNARIEEDEIQLGLFRIAIPTYDKNTFREALINAFVHRDYQRIGMVQVKMEDGGLTISSAGGFIEGVNLDNLLTAPPRSRNPHLASVMHRIGLVERTGRGIDRIFEGMLRYGRPAPDYTMSNSNTVEIFLANAKADLAFVRMIAEQENKQGKPLPIDSLIILSKLREERRLTLTDIIPYLQKNETKVRATLEELTEQGLIQAHGAGRGRSYTLSLKVYQEQGRESEYVRQVGFSKLQNRQLVLNLGEIGKEIKRADVMDLCHLNPKQATALLREMVTDGLLERHGEHKATFYTKVRKGS